MVRAFDPVPLHYFRVFRIPLYWWKLRVIRALWHIDFVPAVPWRLTTPRHDQRHEAHQKSSSHTSFPCVGRRCTRLSRDSAAILRAVSVAPISLLLLLLSDDAPSECESKR